MNFPRKAARPLAAALITAAALGVAAGCAPLLVGGAMVGGVLVATDRRTTGAQVEDQGIELKASSRIKELASLGHVNATSYNRMLLLTGEIPDETHRTRVGEALAQLENVKSVVNELAVAGSSSATSRANDLQLGLKVKASFVDAKDVFANAVKVVVERGNVYLMGRVSEREAARVSDLASRVPGVVKVVRVFELISEEELARIQPAAK